MRFTIKTKLALGFGTVLVLTAAAGGVGYQKLLSTDDSLSFIVGRSEIQNIALTAKANALRSVSNTRAAVISNDDAQIADFSKRAETYRGLVVSDLLKAKAYITTEEGGRLLADATDKFERQRVLGAQVLDLAKANSRSKTGSEINSVGWPAMKLIRSQIDTVEKRQDDPDLVRTASLLQLRLEQAWGHLLSAAAATNISDLDEQVASATRMRDGLDAPLDSVMKLGSADASVKDLRSEVVAWTKSFDAALASVRSGEALKASKLSSLDYSTASTASNEAFETLVQFQLHRMTDAVVRAQVQSSDGRTILMGTVGAALLVSLIVGAWLSTMIARGLARSLKIAETVASGDLTQEISAKGQDEIGDLQRAMKAMVERLRDVVGKVSGAAVQMSAGSQELAASAEQLSQGSTEQAASTEEASASMEEMAANVKQNADNASQTEVIARRSAADAEASGIAVGRAVEAMQTIAEKISIVQEIARQTDLLALNAAVEAARAGEHGRGFAVVASEVRKLAERSQTAATEIGTLSTQTVKAARDAGAMLSKLVPDIKRTAELVEEITAACREQDVGSSQINQAIQQLDKVTQQNASASEEVSSTSEELSSQAEMLQASIGFFRTGDEAEAAPAANPVAQLRSRVEAGAKTIRSPKSGTSRTRQPRKVDGGFALDMDAADDGRDAAFRRAS